MALIFIWGVTFSGNDCWNCEIFNL